ncbi:MAG TPA: hypothetical protein PKA56_05175 [Solirubrobacterales bacterium]|jgi:hypothetical protein|nr:hypothetical protein [Solirubrobacterales bacterium]HMU26900.1 hypothetical protein [Solirubrobacterales bacterium]HMW45445.1 hypothetical protein [Solirubrobacterales bacterium]HMX71127.1 hypothetical protein [Solirubrobacterales bacterium]HMY24836.1 hypothetical protein [Solirubrobacterales bacterium]
MDLFASVVAWKELGDTVLYAFVGAMAVSLAASLGIWGATKYVDFNQDGRGVVAGMALAVGAFGLVATIGIIALGIYLMVSK